MLTTTAYRITILSKLFSSLFALLCSEGVCLSKSLLFCRSSHMKLRTTMPSLRYCCCSS